MRKSTQTKKQIDEQILPEIREEVAAAASSEEVAPASLPVVTKTRRSNDIEYFQEDFSKYLQSIIMLRDRYANRLYLLLVFEIIVMFLFVIGHGVGWLKLDQWLVLIIAESIIVKTFLTIQIIVKNLFPNKNLLELLIQGSGRTLPVSHDTEELSDEKSKVS